MIVNLPTNRVLNDRPTHDSQKREESLEKVTNVFMEQYTLPTDSNELPNLPTRNDVEIWRGRGEEEGEEEEEESDVVRELLSKHSPWLGMWKILFQYFYS